MPTQVRTLLLAVLVAAFFVLQAAADEPANYVVRRWQTEDGLPQNAVTSVAQTRDGYIWVGTYSGLARFDGGHFRIFNAANTPEMGSGRVTSLVEGPDGTLWIGSEAGELTRYDVNGAFHAAPIDAKWNRAKIIGLGFDRSGDLWVASQELNLMRAKDGLEIHPPSGRAANLAAFMANADGSFWVTHNGLSSLMAEGKFTAKILTNEEMAYAQGVCPSRNGGWWMASEGRLRKFDGTRVTQDFGRAPWGDDPLPALTETQQGMLIVGTEKDGVFIVGTNGQTVNLKRSSGFPTDWVSALCVDREGNIWVGSGGNGLIMIRASGASSVNPPDQWQDRPVLCVTATREGHLWVGSEGAGIYRLKEGSWTHYYEGLPNAYVWSLCEDSAGKLWAGTWGGGLLVKDGEQFKRAPGVADMYTPITALLADGPDQLWVGTAAGLMRYDHGKTTWHSRSGDQVLSQVRCVQKDKDGNVWFGMLGGGLGCLRGQGLQIYRTNNGLSSDYVQCLLCQTNGDIWIGSFGGGLMRLRDGIFKSVSSKQGLADDLICAIEDDGQGNFWLSSHAGVMRLAQKQLNACLDGETPMVRCFALGKSDGLPTPECSGGLQPAGCVTADGRMWFASSKGLACVDPGAVKFNPLPPPVVLEELRVDDVTFTNISPKGVSAPLQIPPGRHRLEFVYAGLSFVAPEGVRFRYRLENLDSGWTEAGTKRVADYNYVPPGRYGFHVVACNNSEVWNEDGASLEFIQMPYFWQTWWFGAGMGALALGVVGLGVRLDTRRRMHRKMEILERQKAVEQERARIARDIHDELGSSLTRITMLSEPARNEPPMAGAPGVNQIYTIARHLTHTMDEIVWAVNPQHDTLEGLVNYLEKFALDFLAVAGIRCRLDLPMDMPAVPLSAETRHNLFLAFKEALHNTVKHAEAREVRISLRIEAGAFDVGVEDDGKGFEAGEIPASRNGLENMRRRLEKIGGRYVLQTKPGQGTKIIFHVPIASGVAKPESAESDYRKN